MKTVKDLMTTGVQTLAPNATVGDAARMMRDGDFGLVPVVDAGKLIGTVTDRDIAIRAVAAGQGHEAAVRSVMSDGVVAVREHDDIERATDLMKKHQVRRLPVLDAQGALVGILSLGDVAVAPKVLQPAAEALKDISQAS